MPFENTAWIKAIKLHDSRLSLTMERGDRRIPELMNLALQTGATRPVGQLCASRAWKMFFSTSPDARSAKRRRTMSPNFILCGARRSEVSHESHPGYRHLRAVAA